MGRALGLLCLLLAANRAEARQTGRDALGQDLSVPGFLQAVERAIGTTGRDGWVALLSPNANQAEALEFFEAMVPPGVTRAVVRERERAPLAGTLPGAGFRLFAEVFVETGARGRIATWRLDIRRPRGDDTDQQPWRIVGHERLSSVEGLHRLSLNGSQQFAARDFVLRAVDFEIALPAGAVFTAATTEGVTALVLVGDGTMRFTPTPDQERGQLRLFSGAETLEAPFTAAYVRLSPSDFEQRVSPETLAPSGVDRRALRRAEEIFQEEVSRSFSLDLSDLSRETWSLLPQVGDFVAEVRTRRFDTLTYARSTNEPEDVTLFHRVRKRNVASYASEQKLSSRGRLYNEDDLVEYDILDHQIDASFAPDREWLESRARMKFRVKAYALGALTLRLADDLTVSSVVSDELGRLLFLRVPNQNSIVVNLPAPLVRDQEVTLAVAYQGRMKRQGIDQEAVVAQTGRSPQRVEDIPVVPPEPNWLFSNRSYWYPQGQVTDYATATIRVTVPADYGVVASGERVTDTPVIVSAATQDQPARALSVFAARQPVRYLGVVVSRFVRADRATVALDLPPEEETSTPEGNGYSGEVPSLGHRNTIDVQVEANRRQEQRGREALVTTAEILRLYASVVGDAPFDSLALAMVENDLPGGHSPAYFAVMNNPLPTTPFIWRGDPAAFANFPEFFLAHEVAHQWWGQAVGWKNYHEQWLSEGFAQYFAALFAREKRGEEAFRAVLRQFRRWGLEHSDQGAVYLGYRLGHIKSDSRVFRALVYNKGAAVLHMLRLLVGEETFARGMRRFYAEFRFRKAGTHDFQRAMEAESGRSLERFFERWIYGSALPRLQVSTISTASELTVRVEQGGEIFDVPLLVSITYGDGRKHEEWIAIEDAIVEHRIALTGTIRNLELNEDGATLAIIEQR